MIQNPVFKGFNPDPSICRRGDDYYVAVSSFEWFPGLPVYHSRDLKHWQLLTHVLTDDNNPDLKKLPSAKGIWAPSLTWCEEERLFYVIYGVMNSMNSRYFDVDNYLITASEITGPWSEPVYLHSAGFDASILHDTDGKNGSFPWSGKPAKVTKNRAPFAWWSIRRKREALSAIRSGSGAAVPIAAVLKHRI